jgi:hypothetical protein
MVDRRLHTAIARVVCERSPIELDRGIGFKPLPVNGCTLIPSLIVEGGLSAVLLGGLSQVFGPKSHWKMSSGCSSLNYSSLAG